ncbi:MAG: hypothetical protein CL897_06680 [Dehalococcoidia bacterium]|nr:hypothetical protein [Dehalococcoidia bacterium]HCU99811.1 hypothetical protein [Dehalococcoidia bacterium]
MFRSLRFWAAATVGILLIVLFLLVTDLSEVADAFREASYWYVAPAIVVLFLSFFLRCYRLSILMRPVVAISPRRLFSYSIIGYMANNLLPARAGELVRAYVLGERERVSIMGTLGTIAVERLFDGCVLVLMLFTAGAIVGFGDSRLQAIAIAAASLFSVSLVVFYWLTFREERAHRVAEFLLERFPGKLAERLRPHVRSIVGALRSVHDWRSVILVSLFSILGWTVEAGAYAIVGLAFGIKVSFAHYVLLLAAANLSIIVPTFFGGTGPFEWAAKLVMVNAGLAGGLAAAYAIVAHAVVVAPATIVGLVLLWIFGIPIARLANIRNDSTEEHRPVTL